MTDWNNFWKEDWDQTRDRFCAWWDHAGLIVNVLAYRDTSPGSGTHTQAPLFYLQSGLDTRAMVGSADAIAAVWLDPVQRTQRAEGFLSRIFFGGDAFPYFDTHLGPGNLCTFLGAEPEFALDTVWYHPWITDPDQHSPLRFDRANPWFLRQKEILEEGMRVSQGRFLVSMPDLVENIDILSALRGTERFMLDLIERPDWVKEQVAAINQVYFAAFDDLLRIIRDPWGGNVFSAFHIWGPGKTAKVQCDAVAMISPRMFERVCRAGPDRAVRVAGLFHVPS